MQRQESLKQREGEDYDEWIYRVGKSVNYRKIARQLKAETKEYQGELLQSLFSHSQNLQIAGEDTKSPEQYFEEQMLRLQAMAKNREITQSPLRKNLEKQLDEEGNRKSPQRRGSTKKSRRESLHNLLDHLNSPVKLNPETFPPPIADELESAFQAASFKSDRLNLQDLISNFTQASAKVGSSKDQKRQLPEFDYQKAKQRLLQLQQTPQELLEELQTLKLKLKLTDEIRARDTPYSKNMFVSQVKARLDAELRDFVSRREEQIKTQRELYEAMGMAEVSPSKGESKELNRSKLQQSPAKGWVSDSQKQDEVRTKDAWLMREIARIEHLKSFLDANRDNLTTEGSFDFTNKLKREEEVVNPLLIDSHQNGKPQGQEQKLETLDIKDQSQIKSLHLQLKNPQEKEIHSSQDRSESPSQSATRRASNNNLYELQLNLQLSMCETPSNQDSQTKERVPYFSSAKTSGQQDMKPESKVIVQPAGATYKSVQNSRRQLQPLKSNELQNMAVERGVKTKDRLNAILEGETGLKVVPPVDKFYQSSFSKGYQELTQTHYSNQKAFAQLVGQSQMQQRDRIAIPGFVPTHRSESKGNGSGKGRFDSPSRLIQKSLNLSTSKNMHRRLQSSQSPSHLGADDQQHFSSTKEYLENVRNSVEFQQNKEVYEKKKKMSKVLQCMQQHGVSFDHYKLPEFKYL